MKTGLSDSLDFHIRLYLNLSPTRRKILQYLRFHHIKNNKKIIPSIKKISIYAKCSEECVRKFFKYNRNLGNIFFKKQSRYEYFGRQTSNSYYINNNLLSAMEWLEIYGYLNAPKNKVKLIISSMEKQQSVPPHPPNSVPPFTKDSYKDFKEYSYIHPIVQKIGINHQEKVILSKYPEFSIVKSIEDAIWYQSLGNKIDFPFRFLESRIISHLRKV